MFLFYHIHNYVLFWHISYVNQDNYSNLARENIPTRFYAFHYLKYFCYKTRIRIKEAIQTLNGKQGNVKIMLPFQSCRM